MSRSRIRLRALVGIACAVIGCLVAACSAPAASVDLPARVGLSYGGTLTSMSERDARAAIDDVVRLGGRWVRADLSWSAVEPRRGVRDWSAFDLVVHHAAARGLLVAATLAYTPPWARVAGCDDEKCRPADPAAFAAFAAAAAQRYADRGVRAWEVWNEPNSDFWRPTPDPADYTRLLAATSRAIKTVDRSAVVVLGGLAVQSDPVTIQNPYRFLAEVCRLGGNRLIDAVAFHPYTFPELASSRPPNVTAWSHIADVEPTLTGVLAAAGSPDMPIWVTEYGAPTGGPGSAATGTGSSAGTTHVTEEWQAAIADDALRTLAASPRVAVLFWYSDRDLGAGTDSNPDTYGLRRADGTPKPAFDAFRHALADH